MGYLTGAEQLIPIVTAMVSIFVLYYFFEGIFPLRYKHKWVGYIILVAALCLRLWVNSQGNSMLNLTAIPAIYCILVLLIFDISVVNAISYTILIYVSYCGIEVIFELIYRSISMNSGIPIHILFEKTMLGLLIVEEILRDVYVLLLRYFASKLSDEGKQSFSWQLLFVPITLFIIMNSYIYCELPNSLILQILICLGSILIYFTNALIFIILVKYSEFLKEQQQRELALLKSSAEQQSYEHLQEVSGAYKKFIHDMNGYLRTMRSLAEGSRSDELTSILNEINAREAAIRDGTYSSNYILDAMIRDRVKRSKEHNVKFTVDIKPGVYVDFIDAVDMISLFGNLLDNALEAASLCKDGWVNMKLFAGTDHFIVFEVKNNYIHKIRKQGSKFLTTKASEASHGYGIENVRQLVQKYGGFIEASGENNIFTATLMLSITKKSI